MASVVISPSILTSDLSDLRGELERISGADYAHVDVMDNHFVPNLSWGLPVVEACVRVSPVPIDAHLMIEAPDRWAVGYAEAGCASVTFHAEAAMAPVKLARELRAAGAKASIAIRPGTPFEPLIDHLAEFDMILLMTVEPGFGGQSFIESVLPKIRRAREAVSAAGLDIRLQVDGGVSRKTIERAADAGADTFVAGSAVYNAEDANAEIAALRELAAGAHAH
ncbi:ribulose-phosphate 3-epimerase [Georgenia sp. Z1344]|uniref:ribulose-phosphate 3-epimerase n=1 Tax=Georgenia sp. Z1344 TaxID=3416706 RepID=UPI003CF724B6